MAAAAPTLRGLLDLSHELGREERKLAILGEGNASTRSAADRFLVKASGANLATLGRSGVTECRFGGLLDLLNQRNIPDEEIGRRLLASRVDAGAAKPSVEAVFHAYLLTLPGVAYVGHTHPVAVNALLCSRHARAFAARRLFPDQIVCCGTESVLVPYTDPGLPLALAIRRGVVAFGRRVGALPRVILLENHGLIALGPTPGSVLAATLMAVKSAEIFAAAAAAGGGVRFLAPNQVRRIAGRSDEHHRQKVLGLA